ncbi:armadillo-type protein [Fimicolochytrium jonesii]|uniref:armadillo-type protein n=1 Tax=Fimicolochytrium jonesii TaxID=1396493 RepID=UPI0022FE5EBC|nr:armadillo-type protein [Fimicolochytrium jonesii]KAI8820806.1 armadillo-type protein [Fimicolochytrium jonesii]
MASAYQQICAALAGATSPDPNVRGPSDTQLKQWETEPGFHSTLQDVAADVTIDLKLRLLAVITLKNGIDKYWRKTVKVGAVQPAEKVKIRQTALAVLLNEENDKIAGYNSLVVSKIARCDYPQEWPDLLHTLLQTIQTAFVDNAHEVESEPVRRRVQHRALHALYMVVKALCSKMLPTSRKLYQQLAPELLRYTATIYTDRADRALQLLGELVPRPGEEHLLQLHSGRPQDAEAESCLRLAALALKTLRRVVVYGFRECHKSPEVVSVVSMLVEYLRKFMPLRTSVPLHPTGLKRSLNTILLQTGKVYLDMQNHDVANFVRIPSSLEVVRFYWSIAEESAVPNDDVILEKVLIHSLRLLKNLIKNPALNIPADRDLLTTVPTNITARASTPSIRRVVYDRLLTPEFVKRACEVLVGRYMVLTEDDRTSWEDNAEEWFIEQEADRWEYNLRGCSEKVFMDLMSTNRDTLQPVVMSMLQMASGDITNPDDFNAILLKDAVYCAVGLTAHDMFDFINFESWFQTKLLAEATTTDPRLTPLQRRIAWLIAQWLPVQPSPTLYVPVYRLLIQLMSGNNDMAVRLTAVSTLKAVVDDFGFELQPFLGYVQPVLDSLTAVLGDVDGVDCLGGVVSCLATVVERLEGVIAPHVDTIMGIVPMLWDAADGQELFRAHILHILSKLVVALRADSEQLHPFIIRVLTYSIDVQNPAHVYLLEDGLDLTLAVLRNAKRCTTELFSLMGFIVRVLDYGSESLKKALAIVECFVILDIRVLDAHARGILTQISETLGNLKPEASQATLRCLDSIIQATSADPHYSDALKSMMLETGLVNRIITTVLSDTELAVVVVGYLKIVARLVVEDPAWTLGCLVDGRTLTAWCEKWDNMGQAADRQLTAIALTSLCTILLPSPQSPQSPSVSHQQYLATLQPHLPTILGMASSLIAEQRSLKEFKRAGNTSTGGGRHKHFVLNGEIDNDADADDDVDNDDDEDDAELERDGYDADLDVDTAGVHDVEGFQAPHAQRRKALLKATRDAALVRLFHGVSTQSPLTSIPRRANRTRMETAVVCAWARILAGLAGANAAAVSASADQQSRVRAYELIVGLLGSVDGVEELRAAVGEVIGEGVVL